MLRKLVGFEDQGAGRLLRRARIRHCRPAAYHRVRFRRGLGAGAAGGAGPAGAVLHIPDVAAGRPVRRPARGRRRRQAEAHVLLRRGASAVRRRLQGVPGRDRADRTADQVQGGRRSSSSRRARPTCPNDVLAQLGNRVQHALRAFTPQDAKALKATVSTFPRTGVRPGGAADPARHRRGRRHRALRAGRADAGGLDPAAGAGVADGARRRRRWFSRRSRPRRLPPRYATAMDRESAYEKLAAKLAPARPRRRTPGPAPDTCPGAAEPQPAPPQQVDNGEGALVAVVPVDGPLGRHRIGTRDLPQHFRHRPAPPAVA